MFEFTPTHLEQVLGTALSQGGHYADLYIEDTQVRSIELQDGKVSQAQQASLCGAGIRVLVDDQTGYAYTMDLTQQGLLNAARFAGNIALHGKSANVDTPQITPQSESVAPHDFELLHNTQAKQVLLQIDRAARQKDPRVIRVKAALTQRTQTIRFANSLGESRAN